LPQKGVIRFLHRAASVDLHFRLSLAHFVNAAANKLKRSVDSSDPIVNFLGAIEGDDDFVDALGYGSGVFREQKASGKKSDAHAAISKKAAQPGKVAMQERLSAGENDLLNSKAHQRFAMLRESLDVEFATVFALPDVAHEAATVAVLMHIEEKNWKRRETVRI
jgi:hypothetical protein